jgi:hypothetical protein
MPTLLPFRSLMVRMGSCANSSKFGAFASGVEATHQDAPHDVTLERQIVAVEGE